MPRLNETLSLRRWLPGFAFVVSTQAVILAVPTLVFIVLIKELYVHVCFQNSSPVEVNTEVFALSIYGISRGASAFIQPNNNLLKSMTYFLIGTLYQCVILGTTWLLVPTLSFISYAALFISVSISTTVLFYLKQLKRGTFKELVINILKVIISSAVLIVVTYCACFFLAYSVYLGEQAAVQVDGNISLDWQGILINGVLFPIIKRGLTALFYVMIFSTVGESSNTTLRLQFLKRFVINYEVLYNVPGRVVLLRQKRFSTFCVSLLLCHVVDSLIRLLLGYFVRNDIIKADQSIDIQAPPNKSIPQAPSVLIEEEDEEDLAELPLSTTQITQDINGGTTKADARTPSAARVSETAFKFQLNRSQHRESNIVSNIKEVLKKTDAAEVLHPRTVYGWRRISSSTSEYLSRFIAVGIVGILFMAPWASCYAQLDLNDFAVRSLLEIFLPIPLELPMLILEFGWVKLDVMEILDLKKSIPLDLSLAMIAMFSGVASCGILLMIEAGLYSINGNPCFVSGRF